MLNNLNISKNIKSVGYSDYIYTILNNTDMVTEPYFLLERVFKGNANYIESIIMEKLILVYDITYSNREYLLRNKDKIVKSILDSLFGFFLNNSFIALLNNDIINHDIEEKITYVVYDLVVTLSGKFSLNIDSSSLDEQLIKGGDINLNSLERIHKLNINKHALHLIFSLVTELTNIAMNDKNIKKLYEKVVNDLSTKLGIKNGNVNFIINHSSINIDVIPMNISKADDTFLVLFLIVCYSY